MRHYPPPIALGSSEWGLASIVVGHKYLLVVQALDEMIR